MEERASDWFCRTIQHACVAAACRQMAERDPQTAPGMNKCADRHHALAGALMLAGIRRTKMTM